MSEQLWYYVDNNDSQLGPITIPELQDLVAQGTIHQETQVWTEALGEQWIPAGNVEGLFEATMAEDAPAEIAAPTDVPPPSSAGPALRPPMPSSVASEQQQAQQISQPTPAGTSPMIPSTPTTQPVAPTVVSEIGQQDPYTDQGWNAPQHGNLYPKPITKGGNFMLWLMLLIGGVVLIIFAITSAAGGAISGLEAAEAGASDEAIAGAAAAGGGIASILILCAVGLFIASAVLTYVYLYRAWAALQPGGATVSPGKAIGFLFIPLFNIYWIFIAVGGLPRQWNEITSRYDNTKSAPKITIGMFVCLLLIPVIGSILWHKQIINAINFMARLPQIGTAPSALGQLGGQFGNNAQQGSLAGMTGGIAPAANQAAAMSSGYDSPGPAVQTAGVEPAPYQGALAAMGAGLSPKTQPIPLRPSSGDIASGAETTAANIPAVPNPLLNVNSQQLKPNPLLGVQTTVRPNPLLPNPDAIKPANKLNTSIPKPAPPAE